MSALSFGRINHAPNRSSPAVTVELKNDGNRRWRGEIKTAESLVRSATLIGLEGKLNVVRSSEYPPGPERSRQLFQELKELDRKYPAAEYPRTFHPRKYEIIHDLAEAHFHEAKEYFIEGLSSADADYRWECISALTTHWGLTEPQLVLKLVEVAGHDPDEQVRLIAIDSLGNLQIETALPLLKKITLDTEETADIRRTAYRAILKVLGRSPSKEDPSFTKEAFSNSDVDWDLLDRIR